MPRYRRHFQPGQTLFLTLATAGRRPWLAHDDARAHVLQALRDTRRLHPFRHYGHVLLDDHLHLLLQPLADAGAPALVGSFKRAVLACLLGRLAGETSRLWQRRYHDHVIRDADDFARHLDYLHFNPVKHGLVDRPEAWPWSSFHAWRQRGLYPEGWGWREPASIRSMRE